VIVPKILPDGLITVDMGEPILTPHLIPTLLPATENGEWTGDMVVIVMMMILIAMMKMMLI
jgi:hypothetical protein